VKYISFFILGITLGIMTSCDSDRSQIILDSRPQISLGMDRSRVYAIFGAPTNKNDRNVAVWSFSGSAEDWRQAVYGNGVFVIFEDDKCVVVPLKTTESDPVSAIRDAKNITVGEAEARLSH
jgi:hypothetical protein